QGDPGSSQFFLSLEDDLMRLFGSDRIAKLMDRMGAEEGEMLTHPLITRSIEQAQKRVELQNFQSRKRLLEYDDVMNQQREVIYSLRSFALDGGEELKGEAAKMIEKGVSRRVENTLATFENEEDWDFALLRQDLLMHYLLSVPSFEENADKPTSLAVAQQDAVDSAKKAFDDKLAGLNEFGGQLLSLVMLNVLDEKWKDHLYDLDQLRNAIHYRSWGQKDPLIEYKHEAYSMFVDLMSDIYHTFTERFLRAQVQFEPASYDRPAESRPQQPTKRFNALGILEDIIPDEEELNGDGEPEEVVDIGPAEPPTPKKAVRAEPIVTGAGRVRSLNAAANATPADWENVGRNDPCPCGSGKKFKKCHGAKV
ncbi:MAG TPA: SEC-C metal-binding domain-containing protein, partial [Gemmatimonadaceae bacterium]|nr:SEC-C metal-binding domain-containing protein [Gemmatimonadaceae bacterium]